MIEEEGLPEQVTGLLSSILHEGESPIYYVLSDIDENGNFGERWLILTKERVITANPATNHTLKIPLASIRSVTVKDYVGNAEIFVEADKGETAVIRFSRTHLEEFHNAAKLIDKIAKQEIKPEAFDADILGYFLTKKNGFKKSQTVK